jgi:NAD-dependent dihydropyrimidine dehydrogenase PreA subunit
MTSVLPVIDMAACTGCGDCVVWCPGKALAVIDNKARIVRPEDCDYCTACESNCPIGAIACAFDIVFAEV